MAHRRPEGEPNAWAKRQKVSHEELIKPQSVSRVEADPRNNPYLAHHYEEMSKEGMYSTGHNNYANDQGGGRNTANGTNTRGLASLPRHKTTAAMAQELENAPTNAFNGMPISNQYRAILKTRRDLPVHAQRYVGPACQVRDHMLIYTAETNSLSSTKRIKSWYSLVKQDLEKPLKSPSLSYTMINPKPGAK
jgi:pre-mRNA-splicing factor ATP-dependent RNA helicase DHX15/PRP43